jgi:hypothetical protein
VTTYKPQTTDNHAPLWALTGSHRAGALDVLAAAVDAHWPKRDHTSDGFIGDARHVTESSGSDHNPWLNHTVRAGDFDVDGIDARWLADQLLAAGAAGDHRLTAGGYVIFDHHISKPDFSGWTAYTAGDPHTSHVHVSLSRNVAGYEDRSPWAFLSTAQPQPPHPTPGPVVDDVHWSGHDLTGAGDSLRGHEGDEGPRVRELQEDLREYAPAYAGDLAVDGEWGHQTSEVLEEFAHREAREADTPIADRAGLAGSDGVDLGPRVARSLYRDHLI